MAWHQLSVITDDKSASELADFFTNLGAVSVTYMDAKDQPVYEPAPGETKIWTHTRVIALFELEVEIELVKTLTFSTFKDHNLQDWSQEILQDRSWERAWMDHFHPLKFADKLWVCPTGQEKQEPGTVCMTLDPGLAFGTGTHPTTALCLEWLASHEIQDKIIIDYGCGSGILAVAALLLGAKKVYCIDIDPQALEATQSNAEKNHVQDNITCFHPEQFRAMQSDIVLANILAQPLIKLSSRLASLIKQQGCLVLSGILNEQADSVSTAYQQNGLDMNNPVSQEDWCRLVGVKL